MLQLVMNHGIVLRGSHGCCVIDGLSFMRRRVVFSDTLIKAYPTKDIYHLLIHGTARDRRRRHGKRALVSPDEVRRACSRVSGVSTALGSMQPPVDGDGSSLDRRGLDRLEIVTDFILLPLESLCPGQTRHYFSRDPPNQTRTWLVLTVFCCGWIMRELLRDARCTIALSEKPPPHARRLCLRIGG